MEDDALSFELPPGHEDLMYDQLRSVKHHVMSPPRCLRDGVAVIGSHYL